MKTILKYASHPLMGFLATAIAYYFGDAYAGAAIATAYFYGREAGQCKACNQHTLEPMLPLKWSVDNHLDFWPVLLVWPLAFVLDNLVII